MYSGGRVPPFLTVQVTGIEAHLLIGYVPIVSIREFVPMACERESQIYFVHTRVILIVITFSMLMLTLGVAVGLKRGDWTITVIVGVAAATILLLLQVLRLEIMPDGFKYRNLSGLYEISFESISLAYINVVRSPYNPAGVARFFVELKNGKRVKINFRTFSIEAAARLLLALESRKIQIVADEDWAAQQFLRQVHTAQGAMALLPKNKSGSG
jgi:hypothetical protein